MSGQCNFQALCGTGTRASPVADDLGIATFTCNLPTGSITYYQTICECKHPFSLSLCSLVCCVLCREGRDKQGKAGKELKENRQRETDSDNEKQTESKDHQILHSTHLLLVVCACACSMLGRWVCAVPIDSLHVFAVQRQPSGFSGWLLVPGPVPCRLLQPSRRMHR